MRWWWLSFVRGETFAGVAIVRAHNQDAAIRAASALGCNPGGYCQILAVPVPREDGDPPMAMRDRLLTEKAEIDRLRSEWAPGDECKTVGEWDRERGD